MPEALVDVMLACRDPHTGDLDGACRAMEFGNDRDLALTGDIDEGESLSFEPDKLHFAGKTFPYRTRATHVGNWCWDSVSMRLEHARALAQHALDLGWGIEERHVEGPFADLEEVAHG